MIAHSEPFFIPEPAFAQLEGNRNLVSEDLIAYEMGYRTQASDRFAWDIALFFNDYSNLTGWQPGTPYWENTYWVFPRVLENGWKAQTYGFELTGQWTMSEKWQVSASYSFFRMHSQPAEPPYSGPVPEQGCSPPNQAKLKSSWDVGMDWQFDLTLRYVDRLARGSVPSYTMMDLRLAWKPSKHFEAALIGRDLLDNHHPEWRQGVYWWPANEVPRSIYAQTTWRY